MVRSSEEILADIDKTLDQLIKNASVIKSISTDTLDMTEVEALQKTQESLLARLVHMHDLLKKGKEKNLSQEHSSQRTFGNIQQKITHFGKLNKQMINAISRKMGKKNHKPHVRPYRRKDKVLSKS